MSFLDEFKPNRKIEELEGRLTLCHQELVRHRVYQRLSQLSCLRIFMEYHVFAVWDFMSLLKGIQRQVTCITTPWKPSSYPKELVRLVNTLVLEEESDRDHHGQACDHFTMYLGAMEEIQADTRPIESFLAEVSLDGLTKPIHDFVSFSLAIAEGGNLAALVGAFYYGRENLLPAVFSSIISSLEGSSQLGVAPGLVYYLKRHIDLDGDQHGPLSLNMLAYICQGSVKAYEEALNAGINACLLRKKLWDQAWKTMNHRPEICFPARAV